MQAILIGFVVSFAFVLPAEAQGSLATSEDLSGGCSPYLVAPRLGIAPPVLGRTVSIALGSAMPRHYGQAWANLGSPVVPPRVLGGLCPLFLSAGAARWSSLVTDSAGQWSRTVPVPAAPVLAGVELTFQALPLQTRSSPGGTRAWVTWIGRDPRAEVPFESGRHSASLHGFSLYAGPQLSACSTQRMEKLCRYIARPALATSRLSVTSTGRVLYKLKRPFRDGTHSVLMEPLAYLERLAALTPRPGTHLLTYHGVLAPA